MSAKAPAKGHTRKHTGTRKHQHHTAKHHPVHHRKGATQHGHHVTAKAHHAKHATGRGWALSGDLLPVCSLEAVAMSLRLLGQPVADDEVAWLWELAGARELSIGEALQAAARFGLAGCRPVAHDLYTGDGDGVLNLLGRDNSHSTTLAVEAEALPPVEREAMLHRPVGQALNGRGHALIVGVDVPGPHAVLATPRGWWSWGELHAPWPCRIDEVVAVSWS